MGVAQRSSSARARTSWLARFGPQPPIVAADLLERVLDVGGHQADQPEQARVRQAAQALGVLRAQQGHTVAGLIEDLTALRSLLPQTPAAVRLIDAAATAAITAYVDELTAILATRATRDPLTGLPNRAALTEALEHEVRATPRTSPPALLLIDLDGFKGVNDTDGHLAGDAVLVGVADLLRAQVRDGDLACRLGGDEFAVVLPRTSRAVATKVAQRLVAASHSADGLASKSARVHLSVGVGWLARPSEPDDLIATADSALYAAKAAGGDDVRVSAHLVGTPA